MRKTSILSLAASLFLPVLACGLTAGPAPAGASTTIAAWPNLENSPDGAPGASAGMALSANGTYGSGYTSVFDTVNNDSSTHGMQYVNATGVATDLGTLGSASSGQFSYATGVNNAGTEVGYDIVNPQDGLTDTSQPVEWSGGHIESLNDGTGSANAINDSGVVVGTLGNFGVTPETADIFSPTGITPLGDVPNPYVIPTADALAINDAGVIAGFAATSAGSFDAVTFSGGSAHPLAGLAGDQACSADSVSQSNGYIDGTCSATLNNAPVEATQFGPGSTAVPLGLVPGYTSSFVRGVNSAGVAVGYAQNSPENGTPEAAIFANGQAVDLNSYLPANSGWDLQIAQAVNDNGQIVGSGIFDEQNVGFTMTVSIAQAGASSGLLGFLGNLIQNLLVVLKLAPHVIK